jgi:ArsR family transcriptional regulator
MIMTPVTLCKCLADDTRLRLVAMVRGRGECCVCHLVEALDAPQPKISRHLSQLRACELLRTRREGQWIHYRLNEDLPAWVAGVIDELTAALPDEDRAALSCCG